MRLTPKALAALHIIWEGCGEQVTRQMIDRLSGRGLIDFCPTRGWWVTDSGRSAMREVTA